MRHRPDFHPPLADCGCRTWESTRVCYKCTRRECEDCYAMNAAHCAGTVERTIIYEAGGRGCSGTQRCDRLICSDHAIELGGQSFCTDCAAAQTRGAELLAARLDRVVVDLRAGTIGLDGLQTIMTEYIDQANTAAARDRTPAEIIEDKRPLCSHNAAMAMQA